MPEARRSRRLFFALWPSDALRQRVAAQTAARARRSGGRPVPPENLHVTLFFLGQVRETHLPDVLAAAASLRGSAIEIDFDGVEVLRGSRVLCLTAQETPASLAALLDALRGALQPLGFEADRWRFRPHVTLARDVPRPGRRGAAGEPQNPRERLPEPLCWTANEFALVESTATPAGSTYTVLARWPLSEQDRDRSPASCS
ncbi:MAG TPA: RNA 2',3'-cyclic phosphodiesterase [Steroidobacter sp.]|nr:RNA 2',3'-cyclic phosphodiesterase [Steroidobacter sp.]